MSDDLDNQEFEDFSEGMEPLEDAGFEEVPEEADAGAFEQPQDEYVGDSAFEAVAPPEEDKPVVYRKPTWDIYTLLLFLALAFVCVAVVFHWLEVAPPDYPTPPFSGVPN